MLFLLACVDPDPVAPLDALGPDVADVLFAAEPTEVAAALTSVGWDMPAGHLDPAGPTFGAGERGLGAGWAAVVGEGNLTRVVVRHEGVRLLLWLDLDGRVNVVPTSTWLDASGHEVGRSAAGVRVGAGQFVMDPHGEPTVLFTNVHPFVRVPIAPELIDDMWVPDESGEARALATQLERGEDPVLLRGGTVLRDDAGEELFRLRESECVVEEGEVLARDEQRGMLVLVAVGDVDPLDHAMFARGWVDPAAVPEGLTCLAGFGFGRSGCGMTGWDSTPIPADAWPLPPGALLYDAPDGSIVGVTEQFVRLERGDERGAMPGWEPVLAPSPWGSDVVWVRTGEGLDAAPEAEELGYFPPEDIALRAADAAP